jgi:hypothetical protein
MIEQMLAAATSALGTGAVGAATRPLDGRAFTVVVDARTGEGRAAVPPLFTAPPWVFILSGSCVLRLFWWRGRAKGKGMEGARRGLWTGRRRPPPPAGRRPRGRRAGSRRSCAALRVRREEEKFASF